MTSSPLAQQPIIIRPSRGWIGLNIHELRDYHHLLWALAWRDIRVRYKQTALGGAWAVIQPVLTMVAFTALFHRLAGIPSDGAPYPLFAFSGLLPWQLFAYALTNSGNSLVANQPLIKKVYFPRLLIPLSSIGAGLVDFCAAFLILVMMMLYYGASPGCGILAVPLFVVLATATALAVGIWLSAINLRFRDVRYVIPFLTQIWLFATPVAYPASMVSEPWRTILSLNPMTGVVEGFRWALLGTSEAPPLSSLLISSGVTIALLVWALYYFRRVEKSFADLI